MRRRSASAGERCPRLSSLWLKTGRPVYYLAARFWTKAFALTFAIGVVTQPTNILSISSFNQIY